MRSDAGSCVQLASAVTTNVARPSRLATVFSLRKSVKSPSRRRTVEVSYPSFDRVTATRSLDAVAAIENRPCASVIVAIPDEGPSATSTLAPAIGRWRRSRTTPLIVIWRIWVLVGDGAVGGAESPPQPVMRTA